MPVVHLIFEGHTVKTPTCRAHNLQTKQLNNTLYDYTTITMMLNPFADFDNEGYHYQRPNPFYQQQRRRALAEEEDRRRAEMERHYRMKELEEQERLRQKQEYMRRLRQQQFQMLEEEAYENELRRRRAAQLEAEQKERLRALRYSRGDVSSEDDEHESHDESDDSDDPEEDPVYRVVRGPDGKLYRAQVGTKRKPKNNFRTNEDKENHVPPAVSSKIYKEEEPIAMEAEQCEPEEEIQTSTPSKKNKHSSKGKMAKGWNQWKALTTRKFKSKKGKKITQTKEENENHVPLISAKKINKDEPKMTTVAIEVEQRESEEEIKTLTPPKKNKYSSKGKKKGGKEKKRVTIIVEDASESESEDDYKSPWRNRHPSPGECWLEPVESFDHSRYI